MKNFVSVGTNAARYQDISLNPQKLAGMCAKLKCCLNYEVDNYVEASRKMPPKDAVLETVDGEFYQFKVDILAGLITYSSDKNLASNLETITADRAKEIIELNKKGEKPLSLMENGKVKENSKHIDLLNESDLSRFDKAKKKKKKNKNNNRQDKEGGNKQDRNDRRQKGENRQQPNGGNAQKNGNPKNGGNPQKNGNQQNGGNPQKNGNQQENGNQPNGNRRKDNKNKGPRQNQNGGNGKNEKTD